jgi:UDP-N-acetylglucosamine--N-acetylmuramyl-(pentapeptide) pyrophosphoryl-undecaprenol N-acetylglucosamine transferase
MSKKIIISGGGTGGHIFPAIAIANILKKNIPDSEILFVGAEGRMEMQKVPEAGYVIKGLPIAGLQRSLDIKNILLPFKVLKSVSMAKKIISGFNPDIAIGVGGYASAPLLFAAKLKGIPFIIQEQNSYAGITNKILSKWSKKICVAYEGMEKFFPKEKIVMTGNPVRKSISESIISRKIAHEFFKLNENKKTVLVIGGSLGAKTINETVYDISSKFLDKDIQLIWQTGKSFFQKANEKIIQIESSSNFKNSNLSTGVKVFDFIKQMDYAFAAADVIVSRAGALSVSELCIVGKAAILVPSPNVAEDHQTKNALALVKKNAAILVEDKNAFSKLGDEIFGLLNDEVKQQQLSDSIKKLAIKDADEKIYDEIKKIIG